MCECSVFPVIDLPGTGRNIQRLREQAGVTVRELQAYFGFEYPQAIYKWQHGECLPSVDNLLALARVLRVPMEDLLVYEDREVSYFLGICPYIFHHIENAPGTQCARRNAANISHDERVSALTCGRVSG